MQFNVNKCTIMSIGKENWPVEYTLSKNTLGKTRSARDLGVQVNSDLRPRQQCILARNRANKILGFIGRCVTNRTPAEVSHSEVVFSTSARDLGVCTS